MIQFDTAKIHQSSHHIALEQNVIIPNVAQAELQRQRAIKPGSELHGKLRGMNLQKVHGAIGPRLYWIGGRPPSQFRASFGKGVGSLFQAANKCYPITKVTSRRPEKDSRPLKSFQPPMNSGARTMT